MIIIPALIVAVIFGLVGASLTLFFGFGWRMALVGYWISGNLGLLVTLAPPLLRNGPAVSGGLPGWRKGLLRLRPVAWVLFGLLLIVWHQAQPHLSFGQPNPDSAGAALGLSAVSEDGGRISAVAGQDTGLKVLGQWLHHIPLLLLGLGTYLYGVARLISVSVDRCALAGKS